MQTLVDKNQPAIPPAGRRLLPAFTKWLLATLGAIVVMLIYLQVVVLGNGQ